MTKETAERIVAPLVGAWIEIVSCKLHIVHSLSLPSWERGLKSTALDTPVATPAVSLPSWERGLKYGIYDQDLFQSASLPSWERGLKYDYGFVPVDSKGRSPRGSVD